MTTALLPALSGSAIAMGRALAALCLWLLLVLLLLCCFCSWLGHWSWLCSYAGLALVLELDALLSVLL
jgi:hypothetical protein